MAVNYDDERLTTVNEEEKAALKENDQTYGDMINSSDKYYQEQINASKDWADTQSRLQQEQTNFAIEQIEQQKEQAHKDYIKEQSGAYADWQKQSSAHGVNAEKMAASGMTGTGYSESAQVSMYNAYQNRVATARESYNQASLNYDNAMEEARRQNSSILAEIAYNTLRQQLEYATQGFQYKNQLILDQADRKLQLKQFYSGEYQKVLDQINTENALAEEQRQYEKNLELQKAQLQLQRDEFEYEKEQEEKEAIIKKGDADVTENSSDPWYKRAKDLIIGGAAKVFGNNQTPYATQHEANVYMKSKGVPTTVANGVLSENDWNQQKNSGAGTAAIKNYSSYAEYLEAYVEYAVENHGT